MVLSILSKDFEYIIKIVFIDCKTLDFYFIYLNKFQKTRTEKCMKYRTFYCITILHGSH